MIYSIYVLRTPETIDDFSKAYRPDAKTKILLISTPLDHPYRTHVYEHEFNVLEKCLDQMQGVDAVVSLGWSGDPELLEGISAIALYSSP